MSRHKWQAQQRGKFVAEGVVESDDDRAAMQHVLRSRDWKGRDWKLRVGGASISFDEDEVGLLAGEITDRHAKDVSHDNQPVPQEIVQSAVDVIKKRPSCAHDLKDSPCSERFNNTEELAPGGHGIFLPISDDAYTTEEEFEKMLESAGTPTTPAIDIARRLFDKRYSSEEVAERIRANGPTVTNVDGWSNSKSDPLADVLRARDLMDKADTRVSATVRMPCGHTGRTFIETLDPLKPYDIHCDECGTHTPFQPTGILCDKGEFEARGNFGPASLPLPQLDPTKRLGVLGVDPPHYVGSQYPNQQFQRPDTVLSQSLARFGFPSGATWYVMRKMGLTRAEDVLGVFVERSTIMVRATDRYHGFTFSELQGAW